ncbi:hypothetical protein JWG44_21790 [Leptospira sp. 201903071]|uniref:hypothetical protein n=1 Tax=Leptospira ainazelensis TaxID=2810034 RepID=UPI00196307CB|nr:hypothetical protein [Leptospira ainazelensis]MBM9502888.1 hypothetical protein [Leptospira ainazelensis]
MIKIETNNLKIFQERYPYLYQDSKNGISGYELIEDNIVFGNDEILIVGIYFIVESLKSGITYDIIKEIVLSLTKKGKRENTKISYYKKDKNNNVKKLSIENISKGKIKIDGIEIEIE